MMSFSAAMDSIRLLVFLSCRMNFPPKSPQSARSRPPRSFFISEFQPPAFQRFSVSAFQRFSVSAFQLYQNAPFFPATSFSPASGPVTGSFMTNGQAFNHYLKIHRAVLS